MLENITALSWHQQLVEITHTILHCHLGLNIICSPLCQSHLILAICKFKGMHSPVVESLYHRYSICDLGGPLAFHTS